MTLEAKARMLSETVREAVSTDISGIVMVHRTAFKGFFLDRMGPAFLRAYYRSILNYNGGILLVHHDERGAINGFAAGFLEPDRFYAHFRARRIHMIPSIVLALLRRPSLLVEIARNTSRVARAIETRTSASELASIGTSQRGTGVGSRLLRAFCEQSTALGADQVTLTTDQHNNDAVVRFYLEHGFEERGVEHRGDRPLLILTRPSSR